MGTFYCHHGAAIRSPAVLGGGYCNDCGADTTFVLMPSPEDILEIRPPWGGGHHSRIEGRHTISLGAGGEEMGNLLTFDTLPTGEEIQTRAEALAMMINLSGFKKALILRVPSFLIPDLDRNLRSRGVTPMYPYGEKEVTLSSQNWRAFVVSGFIYGGGGYTSSPKNFPTPEAAWEEAVKLQHGQGMESIAGVARVPDPIGEKE